MEESLDSPEHSLTVQTLLAEFTALRQEIDSRSSTQHTLLNLNITAVATLIGLVATENAQESLLLLITLTSGTLGILWVDHARTIGNIGRYINEDIRPQLETITGTNVLAWEAANRLYIEDAKVSVNWTFRLAMFFTFFIPPAGALISTPLLHPSIAGSGKMFWVVWAMGAIMTSFMTFLIAVAQFSAPLEPHAAS